MRQYRLVPVRRRRWWFTVAVVAAAALGACSDDEPAVDDAAPTTTLPASTVPAAPALGQTCDHPDVTVAYPAGWVSGTAEGAEPCRFFHPTPLTVPAGTEFNGAAVSVKVEAVPFETASDTSMTETEISRVLTDREPARLTTEVEATGAGLEDKGTRSFRVVIRMSGDRCLIISTVRTGDLDYEENKRVVTAMADAVVFKT